MGATKNDKMRHIAGVSPATGLTPQQERACLLLAEGKPFTEVAEELGLDRTTLYRWNKNAAFLCYCNGLAEEMRENMVSGVTALQSMAVQTIADLLQTGSDIARLKAATWIIDKIQDMSRTRTDNDIREYLRRQCTHGVCDWDKDTLNEREYKGKLQEYGITEEY